MVGMHGNHCKKTSHQLKVLEYEGRKIGTQGLFKRCPDVLKPSFQNRVGRLHDESQQNEIFALQMRYLLQEEEEETGMNYLRETETLLDKYELVERFSMLELALWKASCLVRMADQQSSDKRDFSGAGSQQEEWMEYKESMRCAAVE